MTDYELLAMFNEYETIMQTSFMNFVTIVFAFLLASFFLAERLSKLMTLVVVSVFTLASFQMGLTFALIYNEQTGLVREFFTREALHWHGANQLGSPIFTALWIIYLATIVGGYAGALIFFFHQRNRKPIAP